jgi:hypothetical protein
MAEKGIPVKIGNENKTDNNNGYVYIPENFTDLVMKGQSNTLFIAGEEHIKWTNLSTCPYIPTSS